MKITKEQLKKIIKEELDEAREPYQLDDFAFAGLDDSTEGGTSSIEREYMMILMMWFLELCKTKMLRHFTKLLIL